MATYTDKLNLFKYDTETDGDSLFRINQSLNSNWDKIDSFAATIDLKFYDRIYRIGQPIIRLDDYIREDEVRLEGAEVLKEDYMSLYQTYGNTYGIPSDEEHMILPDFRNVTIWGSETFGYIAAGLPNIIGRIGAQDDYSSWADGAFRAVGGGAVAKAGTTWTGGYFQFDASRSNSIYGKSDTVQPPAIKVRVVTRFK